MTTKPWSQRARSWVATRLLDLACWVEPPSNLDRVVRAIVETKAQRPTSPAPITEPVADGSRQSTVDLLRHIAWLVEHRHIHGFAIDWLDRNQPKSKVNYPPGVGRA